MVGDGSNLPLATGSVQLVTCMEVLEHVGDPAALVGELARVTSDRCVVTVPFEPWFRMGNLARGKNVRRLGNDVEHVQAFTPRRLAALLGGHFAEVSVTRLHAWLIGAARHGGAAPDPASGTAGEAGVSAGR